MPDETRAVKYFSLNPFVPDEKHRCPLACVYCVCHQDSEWHHHPERFTALTPPPDLLDRLLDRILQSAEGGKGFPISLCDYSDPFLPSLRDMVLRIMEALIDRDAANMIYITTKIHPGIPFLRKLKAVLDRPNALRVTVFVSLPPLKPGYEPVSIRARVTLLKDLTTLGIPNCWYLRPLVEEWTDEVLLRSLARELLPYVANHVILSGIVMSPEVEEQLRANRLVVPGSGVVGRKQNLAPEFEKRIRCILSDTAADLHISMGPVMGHRLCGTNGSHAYGCLICAKKDRYCQLFQLHNFDETVDTIDNQKLKELLRARALHMRARELRAAQEKLSPSAQSCV